MTDVGKAVADFSSTALLASWMLPGRLRAMEPTPLSGRAC